MLFQVYSSQHRIQLANKVQLPKVKSQPHLWSTSTTKTDPVFSQQRSQVHNYFYFPYSVFIHLWVISTENWNLTSESGRTLQIESKFAHSYNSRINNQLHTTAYIFIVSIISLSQFFPGSQDLISFLWLAFYIGYFLKCFTLEESLISIADKGRLFILSGCVSIMLYLFIKLVRTLF